MINYNKNKLINQTLDKYYETFQHTLDTVDYVPQKFNDKICNYIFKNLKRTFRKIDKEDKKFQKDAKKVLNKKRKQMLKAQRKSKPKANWQWLKNLFRKRLRNKGADSNTDS